jgi:hypothetical protein
MRTRLRVATHRPPNRSPKRGIDQKPNNQGIKFQATAVNHHPAPCARRTATCERVRIVFTGLQTIVNDQTENMLELQATPLRLLEAGKSSSTEMTVQYFCSQWRFSKADCDTNRPRLPVEHRVSQRETTPGVVQTSSENSPRLNTDT